MDRIDADFIICISAHVHDGETTVLDEGCNVKTIEHAAALLRHWADQLEAKQSERESHAK